MSKLEDEGSKAIELGQERGAITTTSNEIPGYRIEKVLGPVYGLTVRSRNIGADVGGALRSLGGGEIKIFTRMFYNARNTAVERMIGDCIAKGGNAIVAMRFDTSEFANSMAQVCAYGTACVAVKLDDGRVAAASSSLA